MRIVAALALSLLALSSHAADDRHQHRYRYTVQELGRPEDSLSIAYAVSSAGNYAAGDAWHAPTSTYQATVYQPGGSRTFILPGGTSGANGVNSRGEVVGWSWNWAEGPWLTARRAFHWRNDVLTVLPQFGSGSTVANAINDRGTMAGWFHASADGAPHAFTYRNGVFRDLGTWGAAAAEIAAINEDGDVAGMRYQDAANTEATPEAVRVYRGKVEPLGRFFPGLRSMAVGINGRGDTVGGAFVPASASGPSVWWPFAVFGNSMRRLIPAGLGLEGSARGINNDRQVVGTYYGPGTDGSRAFLWDDGMLTDLSNLPEVKAAGWIQLTNGYAISDDGVIVGYGVTSDSRAAAFMLTPIRRGGHP